MLTESALLAAARVATHVLLLLLGQVVLVDAVEHLAAPERLAARPVLAVLGALARLQVLLAHAVAGHFRVLACNGIGSFSNDVW